MQEELIERLIKVEEDARKLEEEAELEINNLKKKYKQRMEREKRVKLESAREEGKKMITEAEKEARNYADRQQKELEKELAGMEEKYQQLTAELLESFFNKIINPEGV